MADGIESYDEAKNLARVGAGFKGCSFFSNPNVAPPVSVGESYPEGVAEKLKAGAIEQPTPTDPWVVRYPNSKMK